MLQNTHVLLKFIPYPYETAEIHDSTHIRSTYITVCVWSHNFSLKWGPIWVFTLPFHSEWLPLLRWPSACAHFPTKSRYDVIRALSDDLPMMWGFLDDVTYVGGIKGWMQGGRDFQFWDFRCRSYRAKLIPSRVSQCAHTLCQPGMLYLFNYKDVFSLLNYSWLASSCNPTFVFIDFSCLSDHQAIGPS